ncbi:MAG: 3-keto-5-aminohexanoate cleavage protein [Pseudomonadota bacterium]
MARPNRKVVLTCAVTGSMHTPTMSDYLPLTPNQIRDEAIAAAQAGASVLHLHARNPEDGSPTGDPEVYAQFLPAIHEATDAVINLTTGGSPTMSVEERLAAAARFEPEMCSLNMGSLNFAIFPIAKKYKEWKYDWEEGYVRNSDDFIFRNTFRDIETIMNTMGSKGTKFEHECYDMGHLYNLAHFLDRGLVKPPLFIQSVFGILGGIGAEIDNLMFMRRTADRLFGDDYVWSVLAAGKSQIPLVTQGVLMGGHARVGLEDSLYINPGELAKSNADQIAKITRILAEYNVDIATPDEARDLLGLKGRDSVKL